MTQTIRKSKIPRLVHFNVIKRDKMASDADVEKMLKLAIKIVEGLNPQYCICKQHHVYFGVDRYMFFIHVIMAFLAFSLVIVVILSRVARREESKQGVIKRK